MLPVSRAMGYRGRRVLRSVSEDEEGGKGEEGARGELEGVTYSRLREAEPSFVTTDDRGSPSLEVPDSPFGDDLTTS